MSNVLSTISPPFHLDFSFLSLHFDDFLAPFSPFIQKMHLYIQNLQIIYTKPSFNSNKLPHVLLVFQHPSHSHHSVYLKYKLLHLH